MPPGRGGDRRPHQLGQLRGRGQRGGAAGAVDRLGDPPGEALLAVLAQHPGELGDRVVVDDVAGGGAGGRVHPHVQRRVLGVGEPALGEVELHRGDTEVEQHAVHAVEPERGEHLGHPVVHGVHEVGAPGESRQPGAAALERRRVAVEPDEGELRVRLEQRLGVPAQPQRGVDDGGGPVRQRRGEQGEHALEQHGHVRSGGVAHTGPFSGGGGRWGMEPADGGAAFRSPPVPCAWRRGSDARSDGGREEA